MVRQQQLEETGALDLPFHASPGKSDFQSLSAFIVLEISVIQTEILL